MQRPSKRNCPLIYGNKDSNLDYNRKKKQAENYFSNDPDPLY